MTLFFVHIKKLLTLFIRIVKKFSHYLLLFLASLVFLLSWAFADNNSQLLKLIPGLNQTHSSINTQNILANGSTMTPTPANINKVPPKISSSQNRRNQTFPAPSSQQSKFAPAPTSATGIAPSTNTSGTFPSSTQTSALQETRLWNLNDVDIRDVIQEISRETGKNFIIDPRVQGKITIVSGTPMGADGIYQVFLSTLQVLGYAALPSGKVIRIVPSAEAIQSSTRLATADNTGQGAEVVARVIPLRNVTADQLVPVLRPLLPQTAVIGSYTPANVLIVAGRADGVERIAEIVSKVDTTNVNGVDVIPLTYALADDVAKSLKQLFTNNRASYGTAAPNVTLSVDDRSNSLLLSGSQSDRLKLKVLISQLDTPNQQQGNTQVIYLHFRKAQDLVPILAGIAQSYYSGDVATVIGTSTPSGIDYSAIQGASPLSGGTSGGGGATATPAGGGPSMGGTPPSTAGGANVPGATGGTATTTTTPGSAKRKIVIIAEPNTNSIIINAPPAIARLLRRVIDRLDIRPAQILVEAIIAEVDLNTSDQLGIQWGAITQPGQTGITPADLIAGFRAGIGIITRQGLHNLQGVLTAIGQDQNSNILSTPSIVVLDNHQAKIVVGQEVSIQSSAYPNNAGGTTGGTPFQTFDREQVALYLYVTPQIDQGKTLLLSIDQGDSSLQNPNDPTTTPIINIASLQTQVLVNSGDVLVLGGLIQNQVSRSNQGIPLLREIPILGQIFKVDSHAKNQKELLVFIRPVILYDDKQGIEVSTDKYNFIRNEQLDWVRKFYPHPGYKPFILPPYNKPANLPPPFQSNQQSIQAEMPPKTGPEG